MDKPHRGLRSVDVQGRLFGLKAIGDQTGNNIFGELIKKGLHGPFTRGCLFVFGKI
jgi:hypothetical protein